MDAVKENKEFGLSLSKITYGMNKAFAGIICNASLIRSFSRIVAPTLNRSILFWLIIHS
jgi:hypothetical protein